VCTTPVSQGSGTKWQVAVCVGGAASQFCLPALPCWCQSGPLISDGRSGCVVALQIFHNGKSELRTRNGGAVQKNEAPLRKKKLHSCIYIYTYTYIYVYIYIGGELPHHILVLLEQESSGIELVYVCVCEGGEGRLGCGFILLSCIFYILYSILA